MKRKSDAAKHQLPKNFPHHDSEFDFLRRQPKRNYTTLISAPINNIEDDHSQSFNQNYLAHSHAIASHFISDIISLMGPHIAQIQNKNIIASAVAMTNSIAIELDHFQNPQNTANQTAPLPESEPIKNLTDPISGFNKHHFIKKNTLKHKFEHDISVPSIKDFSDNTNQLSAPQKKLPPLMKQLSQQKLQVFVPLEDTFNRKSSTFDFEEMVRERLLKEIENRKLKEKIDAISVQTSNNKTIKDIKNRTGHGREKSLPKQDINFDYEGNKITMISHGKVKSNLKILKAVYKLPKQREQNLPKLSKKFHQRISYAPRGSRQHLQMNNKTISDFGDLNLTQVLKEKVEAELRRTEIKFVEKQYYGKEKEVKDVRVG